MVLRFGLPGDDPQVTLTSQFQGNYFTEMCSGPKAGSYLRLIDFGNTQLLGLRAMDKKKKKKKV
jgi:hypothetical protein